MTSESSAQTVEYEDTSEILNVNFQLVCPRCRREGPSKMIKCKHRDTMETPQDAVGTMIHLLKAPPELKITRSIKLVGTFDDKYINLEAGERILLIPPSVDEWGRLANGRGSVEMASSVLPCMLSVLLPSMNFRYKHVFVKGAEYVSGLTEFLAARKHYNHAWICADTDMFNSLLRPGFDAVYYIKPLGEDDTVVPFIDFDLDETETSLMEDVD